MLLMNLVELRLLGVASLVGIVQVFWGAASAQQQRGSEWAMSARDEPRTLQGVPARLQRALANYGETFAIFAASLLGALLMHGPTWMTLTGAWLYVLARIVYVPLYAAGVSKLRTLVWLLSILGVLLEIFSLLFQ